MEPQYVPLRTLFSVRADDTPTADTKSCFDGMVSTSNHLVPGEDVVYVKTSKPLLWTVELRVEDLVL